MAAPTRSASTGSRGDYQDGRKRVTSGCRRARADWEVLIPEHHEGYISWDGV